MIDDALAILVLIGALCAVLAVGGAFQKTLERLPARRTPDNLLPQPDTPAERNKRSILEYYRQRGSDWGRVDLRTEQERRTWHELEWRLSRERARLEVDRPARLARRAKAEAERRTRELIAASGCSNLAFLRRQAT